jgi:hypothetical protein
VKIVNRGYVDDILVNRVYIVCDIDGSHRMVNTWAQQFKDLLWAC